MVRTAWGSLKFGFFLIIFDLKIDGFDLLPDLLGWLLLINAAHWLAGVHPAFRRARLLGWLIVAGRLLGMLDVGWFEIPGALPLALSTGPLWSGASRLAAALPDLLELGFYANVSIGLLAALEFCALPDNLLRQRLRLYVWVALARIGIGLFVAPAGGQPTVNLLDGVGSAALPLMALVLIELLFFILLLVGWRQAFLSLPAQLPSLPATAAGLQPAWLVRARRRVRRPYAIAAALALGAGLLWAVAFNVPPSAEVVHKLAGGFGIADRSAKAAFSPDGARLAVVNLDGPTKIYAADTGVLERELPGDHTTDLAFSPDGRQLALLDVGLTVYDAQSGRELWRLPLENHWTDQVRWSPDGRQLALLGGYITLVDPEAMTITSVLNDYDPDVDIRGTFAYSPDSTSIAHAEMGEQTLVWNIAMTIPRKGLSIDDPRVSDIAWSPDGTMIATADDHNIVTLWDVDDERMVRQFAISTIYDKLLGRRPHANPRNWTSSVAFSPDGTLLAAGSSDASAGVWSVATGRQLLTLNGQTDYISSVAFSPDGRQVLTASTDQTLWVWNIEEVVK